MSRTIFLPLLLAIQFLTRLPVSAAIPPLDAAQLKAGLRRSVLWFPLVGGIVGCIGALVMWGTGMFWPRIVAVALLLMIEARLTGAFHEDAVADFCDGFGGGMTPTRIREIMKDSRIGSYGALALLLVTLIRWSALTALIAAGQHWAALLAVGALSRAPMALLIATLPNARGSGLSHLTGRPPGSAAAIACGAGLGLSLATCGGAALAMTLAAAATTALLARAAKARIGGQTGDILGASQQLAEAAALAFAAARLT